MVKLSDIVIVSESEGITENMPDWHKKLIKYRVYDCQTLHDYVSMDNPNFRNREYRSILRQALTTLDRLNKTGAQKTYTFEYPDNPDLLKAISLTDQKVHGNELPIYHPLHERKLKAQLSSAKIAEIKYLLGKVTIIGENALLFLGRQRFYCRDYPVIRGIELYNDQLTRVAKNIPNLGAYEGNLFLENRTEKEKIVMDYIQKIIDYLFSNGEYFAWGEMGKNTKKQLANSVISSDPDERIYFIRLASMIRDYTTLEELEGDFIGDGTLKRFILKPSNTKK